MIVVRRAQISHDDLEMQALIWLHMVWFTAIQFGMVGFGTSYVNHDLTYLHAKFKVKTSFGI